MNSPHYTTITPQDDDGLYDHTHHGQYNTTTQQLPPPIYSTLAEGGAPADYSVITERELLAGYSMIGDTAKILNQTSKEETPGDYSIIKLCEDNHTHHGHTAPPPIYNTLAEGGAPADYSNEIQDTSDVYSAVVCKNGKKTTVFILCCGHCFNSSLLAILDYHSAVDQSPHYWCLVPVAVGCRQGLHSVLLF